MPWGAVWGLAFFVAAELVFRLLPTSFFFGFEQGDYKDARARIDRLSRVQA